MRGDLVNLCIPGDVLRVVGIVKALQVKAPGPLDSSLDMLKHD